MISIKLVLGSFSSSYFVHCNRELNGVAHSLAKESALNCLGEVWFANPPNMICKLICRGMCTFFPRPCH